MKRQIRQLGLLLLLCPMTALADPLSLEDIARLQQVSSVVISPDGEHVAFTREVPRNLEEEPDGPAWNELHVIDADGDSKPFITGQESVGALAWHPNGREVTFLAKRGEDETSRLYSIPVDGGEARAIASLETDISGYALSPEEEQVALLAFEPEDEALTAQAEKGFSQVVFEEELRPRRVWIQDLGAEADEARMLELEASVQSVAWSPAGDRLMLRTTPRELVDDFLMFQTLRFVTPAGDEIGSIETEGKLGEAAWSPDGSRVAFIGAESLNDTREGRLMVADADGGEPRNLLPDLAGHVWHVDWQDEDTIVFISYEGTATRLGSICADGSGHQTRLETDTIWSSLSVADDGDMALTGHTATHPSEVFRLDSGNSSPERLTQSNPWLEGRELARQETLRYQTRDGLEIEGILIWPLDYEEGERYPLILAAHGGPESHFPDGWMTSYALPGQHAAGEGYFMFYPNYRGSTGRGVEFTETSQGRPAAEEFDDLVDGVDHLIDQGWVDGDRVGITGGSYGGYASAWAATYYTERFAAAVMNVGLTDKIAMVGTSDIPQELYHAHYLTWPWEDWDLFREASPIYYASQAQTPILIMHGDADPRVDPTQSRILYRYLSLQDDPPPVRLVLYPGEGHGNRRAASRWDYSLRLMRWMDHYLQGPGGEPPTHELDYGLE